MLNIEHALATILFCCRCLFMLLLVVVVASSEPKQIFMAVSHCSEIDDRYTPKIEALHDLSEFLFGSQRFCEDSGS